MKSISSETELLLAFRSELSAFRLALISANLRFLLQKANFDPNQPRVPRGNPDGGQWTKIDDGASSTAGSDRPTLVASSEKPPDVPEKKPPSTRERNKVAVRVARYWQSTASGRMILTLARAGWLIDHAGHTIRSYLDGPKTLLELQEAATKPAKKGYSDHHVVEQASARRDGFPETQINAPENLVRIPTFKHWEITAWYMTKNEDYDWKSPREYLRTKSWAERYQVGLKALVRAGVLKR